jgi:hypothetical protein
VTTSMTVTEVGRRKNGRRLLRLTETSAANTWLLSSWTPEKAGGRLLHAEVVYSAAPTQSGVDAYIGRPMDSVKITSGAGVGVYSGDAQQVDLASYDVSTLVATLSDAWMTNFLRDSEDLTQATWTKAYVTINGSAGSIPGYESLAFTRVRETTDTNFHVIAGSAGGATGPIGAGESWRMSAIVRMANRTELVFQQEGTGFTFANCRFRFSSSDAVKSAAIDSYDMTHLGDGYWLINAYMTSIGSGTAVFKVYPAVSGSGSYAGNTANGFDIGRVHMAPTAHRYIRTAGGTYVGRPNNTSVYQVLADTGEVLATGTASAAGDDTITLAAQPAHGNYLGSGSANARYTTFQSKPGSVFAVGDQLSFRCPAGGAGITASVAAYVEV